MKNEKIIVSESNRPFWQLPVAALSFTAATVIIISSLYSANWSYESAKLLKNNFELVVVLVVFGVGFCSQRKVYIDLVNSKFRATIEIGPLKFGRWQTIKDPEYISVFLRAKVNDDWVYEVNLWYDSNKHIELYEQDSYLDAFRMGFEISEILDIKLLDATENEQKWINKEEWKQKMNE